MTNEILSIVRERIQRFIRRGSKNNSNSRFDTSDIVQDALIQAWIDKKPDESIPGSRQCADELAGDGPDPDVDSGISDAWLKVVAKGHVSKNFRFHLAEKRSYKIEATIDEDNDVVSRQNNPSQNAENNELIRIALLLVAELPGLQRAVFKKRFFEGQSISQISAETDVSEYRVNSILFKILLQLKKVGDGLK